MTDYVLDLSDSDFTPETFPRDAIERMLAHHFSNETVRVVVERCEMCRHGRTLDGMPCVYCNAAGHYAYIRDLNAE